jgi:hypothetical protein
MLKDAQDDQSTGTSVRPFDEVVNDDGTSVGTHTTFPTFPGFQDQLLVVLPLIPNTA